MLARLGGNVDKRIYPAWDTRSFRTMYAAMEIIGALASRKQTRPGLGTPNSSSAKVLPARLGPGVPDKKSHFLHSSIWVT